MEIPEAYLNKIRPRDDKNQPRSERDEMLDLFLARLNASRIKDGFPKLTHARVAKMLAGIPTDELYALFKTCSDPSVKSFGAMLTWKLKSIA